MRSIRRFRSALGLFAVAVLVAAAGCGSERTDQQGASATTRSADAADQPEATWAPTVNDAPEPVATVTATAVEVSGPFDALLDEDENAPMIQWLVPWDGGFLAVAVRTPAQPLPDRLPTEVADLFPPEVTALFPDGLPATQQEAVDILEEAGLFDVVLDILNENPEAMDAVQSVATPDPELVAMWSIDGEEWTPTAIATPPGIGWGPQLAVAGDRLTLAGPGWWSDQADPWIVTVASTTDLENWDTAQITVPEGETSVSPVSVAADDEHWVVRMMAERTDPTSGTRSFEPQLELWSSAWDGDPTLIETDGTSWVLLSTSEGFLDLGEDVRFSPDGKTWTEGAPLGPNVSVQTATPLGDDVLAITSAPYGDSSILLLDATGTTVDEVEIPELGDRFSTWSEMSSPAFVVETATPDPSPQTIVVEHDGFELTQEFGAVAAYQLVDLATGDVVAQESVDLRTTEIGDDGPFEHLVEGISGITITDPDTGDTIVEIPQSAVGRAWQSAQRDAEATAEQPDRWLLATTDGETWLLEDLGDGEPDEFDAPILATVNGATVLTGPFGWEPGIGTWQRYTMAE
jgi:hypothetical protein